MILSSVFYPRSLRLSFVLPLMLLTGAVQQQAASGQTSGVSNLRSVVEKRYLLSSLRKGERESGVRALLGKPDDIRPRRDNGNNGKLWAYGCAWQEGFARVGVVLFDSEGLVDCGLSAAYGDYVPAPDEARRKEDPDLIFLRQSTNTLDVQGRSRLSCILTWSGSTNDIEMLAEEMVLPLSVHYSNLGTSPFTYRSYRPGLSGNLSLRICDANGLAVFRADFGVRLCPGNEEKIVILPGEERIEPCKVDLSEHARRFGALDPGAYLAEVIFPVEPLRGLKSNALIFLLEPAKERDRVRLKRSFSGGAPSLPPINELPKSMTTSTNSLPGK